MSPCSSVSSRPSEHVSPDVSGLLVAQLAIGVLGVHMVTSEYSTGQIRATLATTPHRLTVLAAKASSFVGVVVVVGLVTSLVPSASDRPFLVRTNRCLTE